jgi:Fe-S-cluster containining protein
VHERPAGAFGPWLDDARAAIRGERDADVPCDGCTACCEAGHFVHIDPDETDTLAHVPAQLLFDAPGLPSGHRLLGHDEHGRCPMLLDGRCSIYAHRPRACRTYDCRVYAAAGVVPDHQPNVAVRVREWRFAFRTAHDVAAGEAVRARADELGGEPNPTARAIGAVMTAAIAESDGPAGR